MKRFLPVLLLLAPLALVRCGGTSEAPADADDYESTILAWREARIERLRSENGWLSLVGLEWLEPGENRFGTATDNAIVLPAGTAPEHAGTLVLDGGDVRLVPEPDAGITIRGEPAGERRLADDLAGEPDVLEIGRLRLYVIRRGERVALRIKDPEGPARRGFRGIESYPIDPAYRVRARLEPYPEPRSVTVSTVVGVDQTMTEPGLLRFELDGRQLSLVPLLEAPDDPELFLLFKDETSATETYGAGRYLYATLEGSEAWVDFNKSYNPPCAFTPYATCPLPPPENRLPVAVRAGEKRYAEH